MPHVKLKKTCGSYSIQESKYHINILKALAVYFALKLYCKDLKVMGVHFKVDSVVVVCCISKQTSSVYGTFKIKTCGYFSKKGTCEYVLYTQSKENKIAEEIYWKVIKIIR